MAEGDKTYTEAEMQALLAERDALIAKRDEILSEKKKVGERLKAFEGIDPEDYKTTKQKLAELEQRSKAEKAGVTSEELNRLRAEVRADLEREFSPLKSERDAFAKENRELKLDTVVKGLMGKHGVRAERIDALFRLAGNQFDLTDDGKPVLRERMGTPVEKYIAEELVREYPEFYMGSGSSGSGASKSTAGGGGVVRQIASTNSPEFLASLKTVADGTTVVGA